ncbi:PH domain-containing protein [Bacillus massilinigeriensis]|uniref:PH domain-containing protein n=1 Tax=Bacillus mediterraneensis TaxID=1805474 RepID=UPI0008F829D9|nr:PH domain-containing protein [Bacillus mediterraneensis]
MVLEPQTKISERALTVWRVTGAIAFLIVLLVGGGIIVPAVIFDWPIWIIPAVVAICLLHGYMAIWFVPKLRWKRWRYEVRDQEVELQHGVFIVKRTLVPMIRVQHVDTKQGPLLRKYGLASVAVSTAATVHEIPALEIEEAEQLRVFISRLARVAEEDV